jgi:hypothetical protein
MWRIIVPFLRVNGNRAEITGPRPSYHTAIHYLGFVSIIRTATDDFGLGSTAANVALYAVFLVVAMITGQLVQGPRRSERFPRICSTYLSTTGSVAATLSAHWIPQHSATPGLAGLAVPLGFIGALLLAIGTGEALVRLGARKQDTRRS